MIWTILVNQILNTSLCLSFFRKNDHSSNNFCEWVFLSKLTVKTPKWSLSCSYEIIWSQCQHEQFFVTFRLEWKNDTCLLVTNTFSFTLSKPFHYKFINFCLLIKCCIWLVKQKKMRNGHAEKRKPFARKGHQADANFKSPVKPLNLCKSIFSRWHSNKVQPICCLLRKMTNR